MSLTLIATPWTGGGGGCSSLLIFFPLLLLSLPLRLPLSSPLWPSSQHDEHKGVHRERQAREEDEGPPWLERAENVVDDGDGDCAGDAAHDVVGGGDGGAGCWEEVDDERTEYGHGGRHAIADYGQNES
jgi:hypothetical protein